MAVYYSELTMLSIYETVASEKSVTSH